VKRFIAKAFLLFTIIFLPVLLVGRYDNIIPSDNRNVYRIEVSKHFDQLDYLFVGNSYTYSGIIPAYFDSLGLETYNLGIATAGIHYYELLIDDYLKQTSKKPRNLLLLITPMTFSNQSDNWLAYPIHRYLDEPISNELITVKYRVGQSYFKMARKSAVNGISNLGIKYLGREPSTTLLPDKVRAMKDSIMECKGFYQRDGTYNPSIYEKDKPLYLPLLDSSFPFDELNDLINLCEKYAEKGIQVILYEMPTNKLQDFISKSYLANYEKAVLTLKKSNRVIRNRLNLDSSYYCNIDHMNIKGATAYTQYLIEQLRLETDQERDQY